MKRIRPQIQTLHGSRFSLPDQHGSSARHGTMAPAAIMALVVVISGVALVLDSLWLDAASVELQTAAESAALASAGELATDDILKEQFDQERILDRARGKAKYIASTNRIAGAPVQLDNSSEGDIRFGRVVVQDATGQEIFVETGHRPTSVVVRAEHSRTRNNPVALFLNGLTGEVGGDVAALAEASIDNRIVGFQPLNGVPIPALPLAILKADLKKRGLQSWNEAIFDRQGSDRFCYHEDSGEISSGPDGIPEITLHSAGRRDDVENSNVFLFAAKRTATRDDISRHIRSGWTDEDLPDGVDGLRTDRRHHSFLTLNGVGGSLSTELAGVIGQCRVVFLYEEFQPDDRSREGQIRCVEAVAGRILSIRLRDSEACEIIFQPGVLTTRTALLASETLVQGSWDRLANTYIYKLRLTH